jgi:hypothetical protein
MLWNWSPNNGIPTIGTPLTADSIVPIRPPWVMNSLTFGWPGTEQQGATEFGFNVSHKHCNAADGGGRGLCLLHCSPCSFQLSQRPVQTYRVTTRTPHIGLNYKLPLQIKIYFALPTVCTFPWNIIYIKYSCFRAFMAAEDVCILHTFQLIPFLIRIRTGVISYCKWQVKWLPADAFLISWSWVS